MRLVFVRQRAVKAAASSVSENSRKLLKEVHSRMLYRNQASGNRYSAGHRFCHMSHSGIIAHRNLTKRRLSVRQM